MSILIASLSWTLLYSIGQGLLVFAILWLALKVAPANASGVRYHLSLSAFTVLFAWFMGTWWQQYQLLSYTHGAAITYTGGNYTDIAHQAGINKYTPLSVQQSYSAILSSVMPWVSVLYLAGLALILARYTAGLMQLSSLKRNGLGQLNTAQQQLLATLQNKLGINKPIAAFVSIRAKVPMVIGAVKPIILLPAATMAQLSPEQLETILLHELAHIKRHDYLVNILQTVVETILFFNPFTWLISANIRHEREHCCDDLVLDHTSEPLHYATALAALATTRTSALTIAASGDSNYLFNRIKRIMEMKKNSFSYSRVAAAILMIAGITCSVAWLAPKLGRPKKDKHAAVAAVPPATAPPARETIVVLPENTTKPAPAHAALPAQPAKAAPPALPATPAKAAPPEPVAVPEEKTLINRLSADNLVSEIKGFTVEKMDNRLFVNGKELPAEAAAKYMTGLKKEFMYIQVLSFGERLKMHPDANLQQLIMPASFNSGCVDYGKQGKKGDGC